MTIEPIGRRGPTRKADHWLLVLVILLAFALRVYDLGEREFWFDEVLSANVSGLGWEGAVEHLRSAPFEHPPLYYLSLYPWQLAAGTTEFAFRFYSVFWGTLFVPLLYLLIRRLAGRRVALVAALLAALSPFLVAYSQEARMYSLLSCLSLMALLSFHNALQRPDRPGWWLVYMALVAVGMVTHYFFGLLWAAGVAYLLLEGLRTRRLPLWGMGLQILFLLMVVAWFVAAPGFRVTLVEVLAGNAAFDLAYKLNKVMPTLMLSEVSGGTVPLEAHVLAIGSWLLVLIGVWWSRRGDVLGPRDWRFLMVFLVVPLVGSFLIPYGVLGRHLAYILAPLMAFMALGLLALGRWGRPWLAVGILALLLSSTYGLATHYTDEGGDLGQAVAYIDEQAQAGDLILLTQPLQSHLMEYYNAGRWPVRFVPTTVAPPTAAQVDEALTPLSRAHQRLWLGPVGPWTADPERLVDRWLTANAFQAEKTWFPASSSVALYFTDDGALMPQEVGQPLWGGGIRLESLSLGPLEVRANDAVRIRCHWRAGDDLDERYVVNLRLVDDEGRVWAERHSEPCGGWCPTDTWAAGRYSVDQHALLIPPGTPPGTYQLQVAWTALEGGGALPVERDGEHTEQITVAQVTVLRPEGEGAGPWTLPNPLRATFGGEVTLLGYQPRIVEVQPGQTIHLETYWRAEKAPSDDYDLLVELVDWRGTGVASWKTKPTAGFFPTSAWQAGDYVRGEHDLRLPGTLRPGRYRLQLALLTPGDERPEESGERLALSGQVPRQALGGLLTWQGELAGHDLALTRVRVVDRPRQFELPAMGHQLEATVGRQAHLRGYDLDLGQAHPGGQVRLTLYWQAGGPMVKPFKVFVHLLDAEGVFRAQHDAPPGGGCCPADAWAEEEVIVDDHLIPLAADLVPGTYRLVVGMYDEETAERVPAYAASGERLLHDQIPVGLVTVGPPPGPPGAVPTGPTFELGRRIFLPLLLRGHRVAGGKP